MKTRRARIFGLNIKILTASIYHNLGKKYRNKY